MRTVQTNSNSVALKPLAAWLRPLGVAAAALALASCTNPLSGVFGALGGGDSNEPKIEGERVPVMLVDAELKEDPTLRASEVIFPPASANVDWPQPGGQPSHAPYHLALGPALKEVWKSKAGAPSDNKGTITANPVIGDGKIFVRDARSGVTALDVRTGRTVWEVDLTPGKEKDYLGSGGGVAFGGGRVFATTGFGFVAALDARNGTELWRAKLGLAISAAPTVKGNRVYLTTFDNQFYALDVQTGETIWAHRGMEETAKLRVSTSPAIEGDLVVAPYSSGEVYGIHALTGRAAWNDSLIRTGRVTMLSTMNDVAGRPVIDRGIVYAISHSGRIVAIDARLGQRIWTLNVGGTQTPWVVGDFVYVLTDDAELLCVSRLDGRVKWIEELQQFKDMEDRKRPITWSGPILAGGRLLLTSSLGEAVSIDPSTGEILKRSKIAEGVLVPPIVANQTLYVLTDAAEVYAYR